MSASSIDFAIDSFRRAARNVPAYRILLDEAGVNADLVHTSGDFLKLPILSKKNTFQRFPIEQLCTGGQIGPLGTVLTSSGHSGVFSFGLTDAQAASEAAIWTDGLLDALFKVKSEPTLLINCLPMGVKVHTQSCTLAETSVRADMAVGLVKVFAPHFYQIILVGEAAFIKHVLESGRARGVNWKLSKVHVILGEEPLAENARKYLEGLLGIDVRNPSGGMVVSSMGVAELGLNLFAEAPPAGQLPLLRRILHETPALRREILGERNWVPVLFTYDPRRIFVEFDASGCLLITTLEPQLRVPLIRYSTGDRGRFFRIPLHLRPAMEAAGIRWEILDEIPLVALEGRGEHALAGKIAVYPEAVKEGIYHDPALAGLLTANFRLVSGPEHVRVRLQLSPGVQRNADVERKLLIAINHYVSAPLEVSCESYESFGSGMSLDYERKFSYLGE